MNSCRVALRGGGGKEQTWALPWFWEQARRRVPGGGGAGIWPLCLGFSVFAGARSRRSQLSVKRIPDTDLMASNEICALSRACILKYK